MGKTYDTIDERLAEFIGHQHLFFVATAPLAADGLVNCSPKGLDSFRILGPREVAYVDYHGSGIETVAHLRENGRIVVTFCAFEGPPNILRLHGHGRVVEPPHPEFPSLLAHFSPRLAVRSIVRVDVTRIGDSCGFGVPLYAYRGQRDHLVKWAKSKGERGLVRYQDEKNAKSLDGLPGLDSVSGRNSPVT